MTYTYDTMHGWLKGISSPCGFSEVLLREDAQIPLFTGNIGSMLWRNTTNGEQHRYDYSYDGLGRLTDSEYSSSTNGTDGRFDESVTYNANGSIISLQRGGMKNDGTFGTIDDLTVTYDGNRLLKVTDDAEALNYNGALDFHDGEDADIEYTYDSNGALTRDKNKGIRSITYDYGHHPYYIDMNQGRKPRNITNDYTPDGRKLSSSHKISVSNGNGSTAITIKDLYVDGLILRADTTLMWQFDGGYVDLDTNGTPTCWNYYVTDHLGSTRMVVSSNDSIRETINYYPFGSEMRMEAPAQIANSLGHPFRFTGKELDKISDLNMYDFGARWYDVAGVPMWTSVDPLAEKNPNMTPYHFCHDNPVNRIDPDGMDDHFDEKGNFIERTKTGSEVMIMSGDKYKNITEVDFSNNKNAVENIGRHYLSKADQGEFNLTASNTGGDIPPDAVFSNDGGSPNYNIYLTDGHVNKTLGNCYNFECVTYHESTHRYDNTTLGGPMGEVNAILRTANECPSWNSASVSYVQSQASYAKQKLNMLQTIPRNVVQKLNNTFIGIATFELHNNKVSVSNHLKEVRVCGGQRE